MKQGFPFLAALFWLVIAPLHSLWAHELEIITDPHSGFAIDGYDPITYFTDHEPQPGIDGYEARWGGVSWRFINEGNLRAFLISPHIYAPRFAGYDAVAVSHGYTTRGDPQIYALYKDRLFFFFSVQARDEFVSHPQQIIRVAEQNWQKLKEEW